MPVSSSRYLAPFNSLEKEPVLTRHINKQKEKVNDDRTICWIVGGEFWPDSEVRLGHRQVEVTVKFDTGSTST